MEHKTLLTICVLNKQFMIIRFISRYDNITNRGREYTNDKWFVPLIEEVYRLKKSHKGTKGKII